MRSIEHDTLSEMGLVWLAARCGSFRGAPEVQVAPGYVADGASLSVMYHSEFRARCSGWGVEPKTIRYELNETEPGGPCIPREDGDIADYFASVFEAKATRADFLSTFGGRANEHANRNAPVAHLHWVVVEKGVCVPGEVPAFWGLLQRRGRGLSELKKPTYCPQPEQAILKLTERLIWKPARGTRLILPCCPECNGPINDRKRHRFSAEHPAHLMDDDPDDSQNPT